MFDLNSVQIINKVVSIALLTEGAWARVVWDSWQCYGLFFNIINLILKGPNKLLNCKL